LSGWQPGSPPGGTYWEAPREDDPLRPGQIIRRGWRLYRHAPQAFVLVALVPAVLQTLLAIPSLAASVRGLEAMADVFGWYIDRVMANPNNADSLALQAEFQAELEFALQAALVPTADAALVMGASGALAWGVALIGTAALSAAALMAADGRRIDPPGSFRAVFATGGLMKPIVALVLASLVASLVPLMLQTSSEFQTWAGEPGSPRSVLLGSLLSLAAIVLAIGVVILAVRWALYIPAVLVERLGVGPGLARAAQLSRGIRGRIFVAMLGLLLFQWLTIALVAVVVGVSVGLAVESIAAGFAAYLAVGLLGSLFWAPVLPAMLTLAYRERSKPA
jgi:hypothetical protein